jgi:hemerythrin-like domain-containing protein
VRVTRILSKDQEFVARFLAVLGRGLVIASRSKTARPGFFIFASNFMREYLESEYFKKEDVLLQALVECGFPGDSGPVGGMRADHSKSRLLSATLAEAAKAWQAGDESGRAESIYTTSEYTGLMHHHFEQLRRLINPLLEQTITPEGELKVMEELNRLEFAVHDDQAPTSFPKIVDMLEEEAKDWES